MEAFDSSIFPRQRASSRSRHHPKGRPNHGSGSDRAAAGLTASDRAAAGPTAFDRASAAELRRRQVRVIDIRGTHTETGLASGPIAGQPPRLPAGGSPEKVVHRIVAAIVNGEKNLPAAAFDR